MNVAQLKEADDLANQLEDVDAALAEKLADCGDLTITFREGFTNAFTVTVPGENIQAMLESRRSEIVARLLALGVEL
jgi:hypothetical protein